jgi:dolichyl-phosphate mannosyltransferase polypeptide 2 regulatory subunit
LEESNPLQPFFPDRYYAVAIPAVLLVLAITVVTAFVGMVIMKTAAKKTSAAAEKKGM